MNTDPVLLPADLLRVFRSPSDCAPFVGERHALAAFKLIGIAKAHGQGVALAVVPDRRGGSALVAKALGSGDWACVT